MDEPNRQGDIVKVEYELHCTECGQTFEYTVERKNGRDIIRVDWRTHPKCVAMILRRGGHA